MALKALLYLLGLLMLYHCGGRALAATEAVYCLSFKNLELYPQERLSRFDLHITSGVFVGFPRVPLDWLVVIKNAANWLPEISGNAIHGAAALKGRDFTIDFIRVAGIPMDLVKSGMPERMAVRGFLELSKGDTKRVLPISTKNIILIPESRCGAAKR